MLSSHPLLGGRWSAGCARPTDRDPRPPFPSRPAKTRPSPLWPDSPTRDPALSVSGRGTLNEATRSRDRSRTPSNSPPLASIANSRQAPRALMIPLAPGIHARRTSLRPKISSLVATCGGIAAKIGESGDSGLFGALTRRATRASSCAGIPTQRSSIRSGSQISSRTNLPNGRCFGSVRRTHSAIIQPKV